MKMLLSLLHATLPEERSIGIKQEGRKTVTYVQGMDFCLQGL